MKLYNPAQNQDISIPYGYFENKKNRGVTYKASFDVVASQDGVVVKTSFSNNKIWGRGYTVLIKHANDLYTFYAYGATGFDLKIGDRVMVGQHIFSTGPIGNTKAPKLYFEARRSRSPFSTFDPYSYIGPNNYMPGVQAPETQSLKVNGKMNKKTWKAIQESLKVNRTLGYEGLTDGIPGDQTWTAMKNSATLMYTGPKDRIDKSYVILAIQRKMYAHGFMDEHETGVWDKKTVSTLQRILNSGRQIF